MSYTVAPSGAARPRPGTVTVAVYLLYATAAFTVLILGLSIYSITTRPELTFGGSGVDQQTASSLTTVIAVVTLVLYAVLAAAFVTLGVLVGRGKNPARIVTWVVGGVGALCCGCNMASTLFGQAMVSNMQGVDQATLDELNAATQGWEFVASAVLYGLVTISLLATVILLALPASNDFFRAEQQVWTPPAYPPAGGTPPAGPVPPASPLPPTGEPKQ